MKCLMCQNQATSSYGQHVSGKFCSIKCARSFSSKQKRRQINKIVSEKLKGRHFIKKKPKKRTCKWVWSQDKKQSFKAIIKAARLKIQSQKSWDKRSWWQKKRRILKQQNEKCNICKLNEWMGKPLSIHIHHKDGYKINNKKQNLQGLCPNCHSQTQGFGHTAKKYIRQKGKIIGPMVQRITTPGLQPGYPSSTLAETIKMRVG